MESIPKFSPCRSAASIGSSDAMATFHTAPSSPTNEFTSAADKFADWSTSDSDDFEFETSRRFADDYIDLEIRRDSEWYEEDFPPPPQEEEQGIKPNRGRGESLPAMAFADELFRNGLVMPLKPPPRLRHDENPSSAQFSIPPSPSQSPMSPRIGTVFKVPYVHRRAAWNDEFDPFKAALEKVSEESRRRKSIDAAERRHHRRARSHSPFRANNSADLINSFDQQIIGPKFGGLPLAKEPRGSPYVRFVIDQMKQAEQNEKNPRKIQKFSFGKRVRPKKTEQGGTEEDDEGNVNGVLSQESGIKRIRSIWLKYTASFGRANHGGSDKSTNWRSNLKKFSFRVKGHGGGNEKKIGIIDDVDDDDDESRMEIMEYKRSKPSLALCF